MKIDAIMQSFKAVEALSEERSSEVEKQLAKTRIIELLKGKNQEKKINKIAGFVSKKVKIRKLDLSVI